MISLPGGGAIQQLETWLRVSQGDDIFGTAKDPVADDHLDFKRKPGAYPEESHGVRVGQALVDDHKGVRVEDHQGKEVANEGSLNPGWRRSRCLTATGSRSYSSIRSAQSGPLVFLRS